MNMPDLPWHFCARLEDLTEAKISELPVGGKQICLLLNNQALYAFAATCPHAGAKLCEGWLDAQARIVCPLHKYRFNPANGHNSSGEGYKLKTYRVKEEEGSIFVQF